MGRQRRPYLPGGIFHLTARTLRREHRFTPRLRSLTVAAVADAAERSGCRILAVAVMSNHLHIVAQQGDRPLSEFMQPLLRRLAHRIQEAHNLEGPVFWRPYASRICRTPSHARNAIVYTHLNPVRAGLCDTPADYRWTSHKLYDATLSDPTPELQRLGDTLDPTIGLPLFATGPNRSVAELRDDYRAFVAWRIDADRTHDPHEDEMIEPPAPWRRSTWGAVLSPLFSPLNGTDRPSRNDRRPPPGTPDLAALARDVLDAEAPNVSLRSLYGRGGGARASRLRHAIIRRLHAVGFRNVEIARFLGLSESAVSWVICRRRNGD